jgi:rubredoxin
MPAPGKEQGADPAPVPMLLWCPLCGRRHIDRGAFAQRSHHTHACQHCGHVWRPAIVATVGVAFLPGFHDEPAPSATRELLAAVAQQYPQGATVAEICRLAGWQPPETGPLRTLIRSGRLAGVGGDRYQARDG